LGLAFNILSRPSLWSLALSAGLFRPLRTRFRLFTTGPYHPCYYPEEIFRVRSVIRLHDDRERSGKAFSHFLSPKINDVQEERFPIILAGHEYPLDLLSDIWAHPQKYSDLDSEVVAAAHRFHWSLISLSQGVSSQSVQLMYRSVDEWIGLHPLPDNLAAWQPYTVAERICNWLVLFQVGCRVEEPDNVFAERWLTTLLQQLVYLADNLEYPASGLVNNHILNNGRALYIGGQFLQRTDLADIGKKIFKMHLPEMVGKGGYLLEASSHYQLLLTRSVLEVFKVAEASDDDMFSSWLADFAKIMQKASLRMLPDNLADPENMPRIGDLSPDIPFTWFDPRPNVKPSGWRLLWGGIAPAEAERKTELDGWIVVRENGWFAITFSHPNCNEYPTGHGHNDFGSVSLYFQGEPVLVDMGRFSYCTPPPQALSGIEARAHNTVLINGASVLSAGRGIHAVISGYDRSRARCEPVDDGKGIIWSANLPKGLTWKRSLDIEYSAGVRIVDTCTCNFGTMSIEGYLYLSPHIIPFEKGDNRFLLQGAHGGMEMVIEGADSVEIEDVSLYPAYGVQTGTRRLHWSVNDSGDTDRVISTLLYPLPIQMENEI